MTWPEILAAYPYLRPLFDTLKPVIGDAYNLLLSGVRTKQKAKQLLTLTTAMTESQKLAPHAQIAYQGGEWLIKMTEQPPSRLMLPPSAELQLRLDERRYNALAGAIAEAALELQNETNFPDERPKEDWVARYVESASQVTDQSMEELWGRILGGEIKKPGSFSLRSLNVVSNLSEFEAKLFESHAKLAVPFKWLAFIPMVENSPFLRSRGVNPDTFRMLSDTQLTTELPTSLNLLHTEEKHGAFRYGQDRMVFVRQKSPPVRVQQNCWTFTRPGLELLGLVQQGADPENMQLLVDIFRRFGLEPEVGSYVLKNEGKQIEFFADSGKSDFDEG
jgi:Protein of unknown function (DUF2806)